MYNLKKRITIGQTWFGLFVQMILMIWPKLTNMEKNQSRWMFLYNPKENTRVLFFFLFTLWFESLCFFNTVLKQISWDQFHMGKRIHSLPLLEISLKYHGNLMEIQWKSSANLIHISWNHQFHLNFGSYAVSCFF